MAHKLGTRIVKHSPMLDEVRRYLTDSPDPAKMAAIMRTVDDGDIWSVAAPSDLPEERQSIKIVESLRNVEHAVPTPNPQAGSLKATSRRQGLGFQAGLWT